MEILWPSRQAARAGSRVTLFVRLKIDNFAALGPISTDWFFQNARATIGGMTAQISRLAVAGQRRD